MQRLECGETLESCLRRVGRVKPETILSVLLQVGSARAYCHSLGVVHRDIKLANLMVVPGVSAFRYKLIAFGIARTTTGLSARGFTGSQELLGSCHYMSPEQCLAQSIDARTDIYSLGLVLYEMLTGLTAASGETPISVVMSHVNGLKLPQSVQDIPQLKQHASPLLEMLYAIITSATQTQPRDRYQTMSEILD